MTEFTQRVIEIIRRIPAGKVMTYGQIARLSGNPKSARQVVRVLHAMSSKFQLPWHRVINSKGELNLGSDEQVLLLQLEGVDVVGGKRVALERYQHHPDVASSYPDNQ